VGTWPGNSWPEGPPDADVDRAGLDSLLDTVVGEPQPESFGTTLATAIVHRGRLVAERYGPDTGPETALLSWSMAKSITQALVGILVRQGRLDIGQRAAVPEWSDPSDPRHGITVDQLLRMSSGLEFTEDYVDAEISDTIEMLFGKGEHDVAGFAASFPLAYPPDEVWSYSSGTTNIICRLLGDIVGGGRAGMEAFIGSELFGPLGMSSATAGFDAAGTFVGSSYAYATARDYLRFGLLYLRDGVWDGARILPVGWVDYARTPTPMSDDLSYGAHWWIDLSPGTFSANGYEGQYLYVVPSRDLVLVRLGKTVAELRPNVVTWIDELIACFPES
jgi:CubicO group peptidase (beta-lactamase class C family)